VHPCCAPPPGLYPIPCTLYPVPPLRSPTARTTPTAPTPGVRAGSRAVPAVPVPRRRPSPYLRTGCVCSPPCTCHHDAYGWPQWPPHTQISGEVRARSHGAARSPVAAAMRRVHRVGLSCVCAGSQPVRPDPRHRAGRAVGDVRVGTLPRRHRRRAAPLACRLPDRAHVCHPRLAHLHQLIIGEPPQSADAGCRVRGGGLFTSRLPAARPPAVVAPEPAPSSVSPPSTSGGWPPGPSACPEPLYRSAGRAAP